MLFSEQSNNEGGLVEEVEHVFSCRCDKSAKGIAEVLTSLCESGKKEKFCEVEITPQSLVFIVTSKTKSSQVFYSFYVINIF